MRAIFPLISAAIIYAASPSYAGNGLPMNHIDIICIAGAQQKKFLYATEEALSPKVIAERLNDARSRARQIFNAEPDCKVFYQGPARYSQ